MFKNIKMITVEELRKSIMDEKVRACSTMPSWEKEYYARWDTPVPNKEYIPELQQLVFDEQNRTSIAFWTDGTKTIVRCRVDEEFSQESGLSALYMKKMFGSRGVIDKMLESAKIVKPKVKKLKTGEVKVDVDTSIKAPDIICGNADEITLVDVEKMLQLQLKNINDSLKKFGVGRTSLNSVI